MAAAILDLILTDLPPSNVSCNEPALELCLPVDAHHPPVELIINTAKPKYIQVTDPPKFKFRRVNYDLVNEDIAKIGWSSELK